MGSVFNIIAGTPFLDALADGLLARYGQNPSSLQRITVFLPTRRACRALGESFLHLTDGAPLITPQALPLGSVDEEGVASFLIGSASERASESIPPAIGSLQRQLALADFIIELDRKSSGALSGVGTPMDEGRAVSLAAELGKLLDRVQVERASLDGLGAVIPDEFAAHWQISHAFLRILSEQWPTYLEGQGLIDAFERRNRIFDSAVKLWKDTPPSDIIVAAGSTGSVPATAELLSTIASLPNGSVVLPGLDTVLDDSAWEMIDPNHCQYGLKRLIERLGMKRKEIPLWSCAMSESHNNKTSRNIRISLISQVLRPARATPIWQNEVERDSVKGMGWVDCPTSREEACSIAILMREFLETEKGSCALITPDRGLARRVAAELRRWEIAIDDSAGTPLSRTVPGVFLRLVIALIDEAASPRAFLSALKHPLAAGGRSPSELRALAQRIEVAIFRGIRPKPGLGGLLEALRKCDRDLIGLRDIDWMEEVHLASKSIVSALARTEISIADAVNAHVRFAEFLASSGDEEGASRLWCGPAGEVAAEFIRELTSASVAIAPMQGRFYRAVFDELMRPYVVRSNEGAHPRLNIWGPLEGRLQSADLVILGGLNEGVWPSDPPTDPWMSRRMRYFIGLQSPDTRIGLSQHDFFHAACAPRVIFTRSQKVDGIPTIPSRWLSRLETLVGPERTRQIKQVGVQTLKWLEGLDAVRSVSPVGPPAPTPPVRVRPRCLSATEIETWMRDPYAIYARHILNLKAMPRLGEDLGAKEYGIFVHRALDLFLRNWPSYPHGSQLKELLRIGKKILAAQHVQQEVRTFWWPRYECLARDFVVNEAERRKDKREVFNECSGSITLDAPAGPFTVNAKADRIEVKNTGRLVVVDYKTGRLPPTNWVKAGISPQVPIEAVIAAAGGFDNIPAAPIEALEYWKLSGRQPALEVRELALDAEGLRQETLAGLLALISAFDDPKTPFMSTPIAQGMPGQSEYEHLARISEWAIASVAEDE